MPLTLMQLQVSLAIAMGRKGATKATGVRKEENSHGRRHREPTFHANGEGRICNTFVTPSMEGQGEDDQYGEDPRAESPRVRRDIKRVIHEEIQKTPADACYENHLAELAEYEDELQDLFNDRVNRLLSCSRLCDANMSFDNQRKWQYRVFTA